MVSRREQHRWARCRRNSLKSNMSSDGEEGHCQRFHSLSTCVHLLSASLSACGLLRRDTTRQFEWVWPPETWWADLPLLNRFSRESNQMSKRFWKIKFCSLLIGWLSLYQLSESPRGKKVSAQSVDALWSLPLKSVTPCLCVFVYFLSSVDGKPISFYEYRLYVTNISLTT